MKTNIDSGARQARLVAANLRRLMARYGLTYEQVIEASGLDDRTVRSIVKGDSKPQAKSLHKLAVGLGVSADELFAPQPTGNSFGTDEAAFDRATNSQVESVVERHPQIFANWTSANFDELCSRFGVGGHLNEHGTLEAANEINNNRHILQKVAVVLESGDSDVLAGFVDLLYDRVTITSATKPHATLPQ